MRQSFGSAVSLWARAFAKRWMPETDDEATARAAELEADVKAGRNVGRVRRFLERTGLRYVAPASHVRYRTRRMSSPPKVWTAAERRSIARYMKHEAARRRRRMAA